MAEAKGLSDMEREAAFSWREWPIYVVIRLKRLQAIQSKLRIGGETETAMRRKEEFLDAVYDMSPEERQAFEAARAEATAAAGESDASDETVSDAGEAVDTGAADETEYFEDVTFEDE
jgi:hypothetical protein